MPKNPSLKKVLLIGSGPIQIGQAAEFDYAGTQACKAVREEGIEVVLVNSNPATIQTDPETADKVYVEPLKADIIAEIIKKEKPDGILSGMGGQTGLNLTAELYEMGALEGVQILGTPLEAIYHGEDRDLFKTLMIQIGEPVRVITIDVAKKDDPKEPQVFINPEIVWSSEEHSAYEEGCLSIPEYYEEVERPAQVRVKYVDADGKPHELEADGLLATCLQHEIDHLNGVLFIDHISKLKRDRVIKKFTKAAKHGVSPSLARDKEPSHHIG